MKKVENYKLKKLLNIKMDQKIIDFNGTRIE